jgi:hypothetical protein
MEGSITVLGARPMWKPDSSGRRELAQALVLNRPDLLAHDA